MAASKAALTRLQKEYKRLIKARIGRGPHGDGRGLRRRRRILWSRGRASCSPLLTRRGATGRATGCLRERASLSIELGQRWSLSRSLVVVAVLQAEARSPRPAWRLRDRRKPRSRQTWIPAVRACPGHLGDSGCRSGQGAPQRRAKIELCRPRWCDAHAFGSPLVPLSRLPFFFFAQEPVPCITAHPNPNNILDWHFVLEGHDEFEGGVYHGRLTFPSQYPFKPPSISMVTPNGRFAPNTKLCMSMTDFHPESWNPLWSVGNILTGLLSFMYEGDHTTGAIQTTPEEKKRLAKESLAFNMRNPTFRRLFPEWVERAEKLKAEGKLEGEDVPPASDAATAVAAKKP